MTDVSTAGRLDSAGTTTAGMAKVVAVAVTVVSCVLTFLLGRVVVAASVLSDARFSESFARARLLVARVGLRVSCQLS